MEYYNTVNDTYKKLIYNHISYTKVKIELMDYQENVIGELQQDLSADDTGNISVNYQQGVRRSCSITLVNIKGEYLPKIENKIWINTKFKLYLGVYSPDSGDTYWFSQGVYIITNPQAIRQDSKTTITLEGVDKFGVFGSETNFKETEGTYLIPAGTTVQNIIKSILDTDMGNGQKLDATPPVIDYSIADSTLPYDIEKSPNEYFTDILTELGNIFACDIFYDVDGRLNFTKGNESRNMEDYGSIWDFYDVLPDYNNVSNSYDFTNVYNVVKVIGNNPATSTYESIIKNTEPSSPTNIMTIGEKIKYIESTFCYTLDRANDFAKYMLRKYSIVQQSLSFESTIIPHLEVNNIITLTDSYFGYDQQRFVIQSLNFPLSPNGQVSIEASNTANIPYFEY